MNEASRIRFVNRELGKLEQYRLSAQESEMVQRLMEGETTAEKLHSAGHDEKRLTEAAKTLSHMYSTYYEAINDFLVAHGYKEIGFQKNYAPHMQPEQMNVLQKYLQRMGLPVGVVELPTEIAGRTEAFKPGKQYDPYFQHRVGNKTVYDAAGGLESYVNYLSNVFFHTDDIMKLRRFNEALRVKYSSEELGAQLDQLNHLQDRPVDGDELSADNDIEARKEVLFERYKNMSQFGGYVSVLDDYTNVLAGKQTKGDRALESTAGRLAINFGRTIQNAFAKSAILGNLSSAISQTVQLPQVIAELGPFYTARAVRDVATGVTAKTSFNQESDFLTGKTGIKSISKKSLTDHIFDIAATPFEVVDDFASRVMVRAKYLEQIAKGKQHKEALSAADTFANRVVGSRMKGAKPVLFERKSPVMRLITTFQLEVANGWEHIVHDLPMEIQHIAKTEGKKAAVGRTVGLVVASQLTNFIANILLKAITGREPVPFDGLGMLANYLASGYGMTKEDAMRTLADNGAEIIAGKRPFETQRANGPFNLMTAAQAAGKDALEDVPFLSNATNLIGITDGRLPIPNIWNRELTGAVSDFEKAMTAETDEEREQAKLEGGRELLKGVALVGTSWIPMGSQLKKTAQGARTLYRGGDFTGYGDEEALRYHVERTPANTARGLLFGKSALPETDAFYANGLKSLSPKQTGVYKELVEAETGGETAYQLLQKVRGTKKDGDESEALARIGVLDASDLSGAQKEIVYRGLFASEKELELINGLEKVGADPGELYHTLRDMRRAEKSNDKRTALIASKLLDQEKRAIYRNRISDSRDDDIQEVLGAGMSMNDFLSAQNIYSDLNETKASAAEKSIKFAKWAYDNRYTEAEAETLREVFRFYSQIPTTETIYDKMLSNGFGYEEAYELSSALADVGGMKGDKGRNGKTIPLSESRNKKAAIDKATRGMPIKERRKLYEMFDVSKRVWFELGRG